MIKAKEQLQIVTLLRQPMADYGRAGGNGGGAAAAPARRFFSRRVPDRPADRSFNEGRL